MAGWFWGQVVLNGGAETPEVPKRGLSQDMLAAIREIKGRYYDTETGRVDYRAVAGSAEYLTYKRVAARLRRFDLTHLSNREEKLAFWINLYNTIVVDGVIALGVAESVHEVPGFFRKVAYEIGGRRFSPDDIEHGILRANRRPPHGLRRAFGPLDGRRAFALRRMDPRIHFALVCGSRSCAPIRFYSRDRVDEELELAATAFVNGPEVEIDETGGKIRLSRIFKWYQADFGGRAGVLDFVRRHLLDAGKREFLEGREKNLEMEYAAYDWSLNG
ncbi:MAG: DUF547 domain-containing protein [Deferrisomatales bacterium]